MKRTVNLTSTLLVMLTVAGCIPERFKEQANQQFGDQHFKTAIALVELHKLREGEYPQTLNDLKYVGDWDRIIFSSVKYTKLDDGYELDLINGWMGKPEELEYPDDFWKGLGLVKSNMKKIAVP